MTVVVTGASGHIGGNLVRELLARGVRLRALVHEDRRAVDGLDLDVARGDVLDLDSLRRAFGRAELVYHLAARISIVDDDAAETWAVNVRGTENVVAACRDAGVKRLVHFSSIHALAPEPADRPVDETRPLAEGRHVPHYDRSKAAAERAVLAGVRAGLDAVIVNPTAVVGPHDYRSSPMGQVFLDLYRGALPAIVEGGFDWVDVRDAVAGAIAAAERGGRGERYLLSGHRASMRELAALVEDVTGSRPPRVVVPMWLARAGAPVATAVANLAGRRPRFTRASLHALRNHREVRHDKASRELGYQPRPLRETIEATFAWFRGAGVL